MNIAEVLNLGCEDQLSCLVRIGKGQGRLSDATVAGLRKVPRDTFQLYAALVLHEIQLHNDRTRQCDSYGHYSPRYCFWVLALQRQLHHGILMKQ